MSPNIFFLESWINNTKLSKWQTIYLFQWRKFNKLFVFWLSTWSVRIRYEKREDLSSNKQKRSSELRYKWTLLAWKMQNKLSIFSRWTLGCQMLLQQRIHSLYNLWRKGLHFQTMFGALEMRTRLLQSLWVLGNRSCHKFNLLVARHLVFISNIFIECSTWFAILLLVFHCFCG